MSTLLLLERLDFFRSQREKYISLMEFSDITGNLGIQLEEIEQRIKELEFIINARNNLSFDR